MRGWERMDAEGERGGTYNDLDQTSGEWGSGTALVVLSLGLKMSLDASSSARGEGTVPLVVLRDGAVLSMACLIPESASLVMVVEEAIRDFGDE